MVVHAIACQSCGERRAARETDDEFVPYRDACPNCGSTAFEVRS